MRKQCRSNHVVVPVHGVYAEHQGDPGARPRRGGCAELPGHLDPGHGRRSLVTARRGITAGQDRPEGIVSQVGGCDRADIGLNHLADLLFQRHPRQQGRDEGFRWGIGHGDRRATCGPG